MKLLTIVGIRKSGKTTTVTELIAEITRRGKRVGTLKTIFCPSFSIDKKSSNTARHMHAGSSLVCARAKGETSFIYPKQLSLSESLEPFAAFDYVIIEGDYLAPVPRIVAAHAQADALERTNELTIGYTGRICDKEVELALPVINAITHAADLLDLIDKSVPDVSPAKLDSPLPPVAGVTGDEFCQCGCHHHIKKKDSVQVLIDGEVLKLTREQLQLIQGWVHEAKA